MERITPEEAQRARTPTKTLIGGLLLALVSLVLFGFEITVIGLIVVAIIVIARGRSAPR